MGIGIDKDLGSNRSLRDEIAMPADDADDISAAFYKEELNSQKLERLGSRITLISILLPALVAAILVYGYLDIKKRVMDIHNSGQTQVDVIATEFQVKVNALEVELEKIKFAFEKEIPELKQQAIALQDELTLLAGNKADKAETVKNIDLIQVAVDKIADQYQGALHILDRTNQETLAIVNEKAKEVETSVKSDVESVKAIKGDIESKIASLKSIESEIEKKIDSKVASVVNNSSQAEVDKRVKAVINEKFAAHSQAVNKKIADIDLSVESKLASLQEVTQVLAESKTAISKLETSISSLKESISLMDNKFKEYQSISVNSVAKEQSDNKNSDVDKKYINSQIDVLKKNLNSRVDELNLNLSKKILQYSTQLESLKREFNKSQLILNKPERGKISETDLVR